MKTVIAGLEEGLNAIAEALEGGGGSGAVVPVPTLADDGKVLQVVSQTQTEVAPEWTEINTVPSGGTQGQVLTKGASGYDWANPSGGSDLPDYSYAYNGDVLTVAEDAKSGEKYIDWVAPAGGLPSHSSSDIGKVLGIEDDWDQGTVAWVTPSGQVPSTIGVTNGYVLTNNNGTPAWAAASGGGGSVSKSTESVSLSQFSDGGDGYYYAVLSTVNLFDAYAFTASYSNGDTKHFVQIESVGLDFKSSNQIIAISSTDYTAMSTADSGLYIKVLS